ncbi:ferroxidase [Plasmodiophora brassicae]|uniref:ferroxidase n=1 Tax=Plasmodiophora brassicae TaxID=37360 RepID=A0A0G4IM63_PLABS|nr:hypothetical protein PBRA_004944 [Plasmodiophora brassicae]SPQ99208.1 unnamed protein product [Plasmodiophora brassicae]
MGRVRRLPFRGSAGSKMFVVSRVVRGRRAVWRATRACSSHSGGLPPVWTPQNIDEGTFHGIADDTLHAIDEALTDSDVPPSAMDVQLTDGVLTIGLTDSGTWVLNKQTPNRQLWLSSPISGPKRFDYLPNSKAWADTRDQLNLGELLQQELSSALHTDIRLDSL